MNLAVKATPRVWFFRIGIQSASNVPHRETQPKIVPQSSEINAVPRQAPSEDLYNMLKP